MREGRVAGKWRFLKRLQKFLRATLSPRLKFEGRPPSLALEQGMVKQRGLAMKFTTSTKVAFAFASLDDLKQVTVAVQFGSQPQLLLATRDGFRMATFRHVEEAMDALARGETGAAFVWGPTAGFYNKTRLAGAWKVVPVAGPGLQWHVVAAVRKGDASLKDRVGRALAELGPDIRRLADQYGFPLAAPVAGISSRHSMCDS